MNWKLTDKERQALNYFADYFNSLPLEQRKMLKRIIRKGARDSIFD